MLLLNILEYLDKICKKYMWNEIIIKLWKIRWYFYVVSEMEKEEDEKLFDVFFKF